MLIMINNYTNTVLCERQKLYIDTLKEHLLKLFKQKKLPSAKVTTFLSLPAFIGLLSFGIFYLKTKKVKM